MQNLYDLFDKVRILMKPSFLAFMNEKFAKVQDELWSIKHLHLKHIRMLEHYPRNRKKRCAKRAVDCEMRLLFCVWKQIRAIDEQVCSIRSRNFGF